MTDTWRPHLDTVPQALAMQAGIEACFEERIARPIHHPRLQLIVMNRVIAEIEGFVYSPRSTVTVLHGEAYPEADYSDPDAIRRFDASDLVEKAAWVDRMPLHVVDKPGGMRVRRCANWSGGWRRPDRSCCISQGSTPSRCGA